MEYPSTRLLTLLELLHARPQINGPDLARHLDVDVRSVRRYITMLQDMGIPIEAERGRYGAYRLAAGYKLPPMMFSNEEAFALALGLRVVQHLGLAVAAPAVSGAHAKLERVLPAPLRTRLTAAQQTLVLNLPTWETTVRSDLLGILTEAAYAERQLWMQYRNWQGHVTERTIDPYGVVYHAGLWYVVGYCHLRADVRTFRCDRVDEVTLDTATFQRPAHFNALDAVLRSIAATPKTWQVEVLHRAPLEEVQQRIPTSLATLEPTEQGVRMWCATDDLAWMAHFLAGLRWSIKVNAPAELRAALRNLAASILHSVDAA